MPTTKSDETSCLESRNQAYSDMEWRAVECAEAYYEKLRRCKVVALAWISPDGRAADVVALDDEENAVVVASVRVVEQFDGNPALQRTDAERLLLDVFDNAAEFGPAGDEFANRRVHYDDVQFKPSADGSRAMFRCLRNSLATEMR